MPLHRSLEAARIACSLFCAFALTASASAAVTAAAKHDDHPIRVTAVAGEVDVSIADVDVEPAVGDEMLLPAHIVTGGDGTIGLEQSRTSISIAPDSEIE